MAVWSKEVFAANLRMYMDRRGISQKELSEVVGVSATAINDWANAKKYPRIDKIEVLADYFGILKSDLIEDKTKEQREVQEKNDILSDVVIRAQSDDVFMSAVKALYELDSQKLSSLLAFLK